MLKRGLLHVQQQLCFGEFDDHVILLRIGLFFLGDIDGITSKQMAVTLGDRIFNGCVSTPVEIFLDCNRLLTRHNYQVVGIQFCCMFCREEFIHSFSNHCRPGDAEHFGEVFTGLQYTAPGGENLFDVSVDRGVFKGK